MTIVRHGRTDNAATVRYLIWFSLFCVLQPNQFNSPSFDWSIETIDGSAIAGEDYVALSQEIFFEANEVEKEVTVEIIDDNQYEPDEQFYLKLSLLSGSSSKSDVVLGRISIMEVTILNDDGRCLIQFNLWLEMIKIFIRSRSDCFRRARYLGQRVGWQRPDPSHEEKWRRWWCHRQMAHHRYNSLANTLAPKLKT